jgi:hypothetical protein
MLVTEYLVGRSGPEDATEVPCLIVQSVLPRDCKVGSAELLPKVARQDLVLEFLDEDNGPAEWLCFPDLPADVIELLQGGTAIPVVDCSDKSRVMARIAPTKLARHGA